MNPESKRGLTPFAYHQALEDHRAGRLEDAEAKLKKIITEAPAFEDAYEALSVIFYNQQRYDDAIAVIRKWIKQNPQALMAQTNLSRCYVAKGMILEAEKAQNEARKLTWKAELKAKKQEMPKVDFEAAIARYKKVIELDPKDVLGYYSLGIAYRDSGRRREATDTFEKALEVNPMHSSSYLELGILCREFKDLEKAKRVFKKGIEVAAQHGDIMPQKKMEAHLGEITQRRR